MEEQQHRIPASPSYQTSRNLAKQPYSSYEEELEEAPLEEDTKVVPMQGKTRSLESLAEEQLNPRPSKRKTSSGSQGKAKSTASKSKNSKSLRSVPVASHQPFADELRRLEAQADRINQILADRARKKDWQQSQMQQSQSMSPGSAPSARQRSPEQYPGMAPASGQEWPVAAPLEQEDTENLKLHAQRIKQRLVELEQQMESTHSTPAPAPPPPARPPVPSPTASHSHPWNPQSWQQQIDTRQQQQAEREAREMATELRYLNHEPTGYGNETMPGMERQGHSHFRPRVSSAETSMRSPVGFLRRLAGWRFMEIPRKPVDRLGDGAVWIAAGAIARILFRFVLMSFPALSPVLTLLMLTPAMLAVFLVLFAPRTGWVPFYRLFLITLGLLIGGKF